MKKQRCTIDSHTREHDVHSTSEAPSSRESLFLREKRPREQKWVRVPLRHPESLFSSKKDSLEEGALRYLYAMALSEGIFLVNLVREYS